MIDLNRHIDSQKVDRPLTPREIEILCLISDGLSNDDVAGELFITPGTVKWYLKQIYSKLQVKSRTQAIAVARAAGLLNEAANTGSLSAPHNLPHQSTPFIGRDKELATITRRLADPGCRLLTIVGPGGIGKTRLALQAAERQVTAFAQGVYFVSLAPLSAPESIELALAESIGFSFYPGAAPRQQLLDYLRARNVLLVLDNFEHLLAGVSLVTEILEAAPRVKILATSRERLNLQAETLVSLDGLAYPALESSENIADFAAVKLFLQRAAQIQPDFRVTESSLGAVARICWHVQGMPLGILLAATWVEALPVQDIAQEIQKSLNFLEIDQHDMPQRQRSLRAAFNHSWNLLAEEERTAFKRLSVFRGSFTREAAQQVAGASLKVLMALVHKSLLRCDATTGRHEVHELMRQFGAEQLDSDQQESTQIHRLHCEFYAEFMRQQWTAVMSLRQATALTEIGYEFNNVLNAWNYAIGASRADILSRMALSLWCFCTLRRPASEGADIFGRAVAALQAAPGTDETQDRTQIVLGHMLARQGWFQDDLLKGAAIIEKSLELLGQYDCPLETMIALESHARVVGFRLGRFDEGMRTAEEGVQLAQVHDVQWMLGHCLTYVGYCAWGQGDAVRAREIGERAFGVSAAVGDVWFMAGINTFILSRALVDLQEYAEAQRLLEQAFEWHRDIESTENAWRVASTCSNLGKVALLTHDYAKSRHWLQQALNYHKGTGGRYWEYYETLYDVGRLFAVGQRKTDAVELLSWVQLQTSSRAIREMASASLSELCADLSPEIYAAAVERGRTLDLDRVVTEFLAG